MPKSTKSPEPPLTEERKGALASHYVQTPPERRADLINHFREYGTAEEVTFLETLAVQTN